MNEKDKVVVILSGGLDSTTALYDTMNKFSKENIYAITFNYGSKHNDKEIEFAKYHCVKNNIKHKVVDIESVFLSLLESDLLKTGGDIPHGHYEAENMKSTVVPFRNGIFLSLVAGYADSIKAKYIVLGNHAGDHEIYADCRLDFTQRMHQAIKLGTDIQVEFLSPFVNIRKEDIVKIGNDIGLDYTQTWSCYEGKDIHCGQCGTCVERKEAFDLANVKDPTEYKK